MGILDDAIREHLELKRAHGASDDEIRTKETEVFGPARHDAPEAAAAPAETLEPVVAAPPPVDAAEAHVEPVLEAAPPPVEPVLEAAPPPVAAVEAPAPP